MCFGFSKVEKIFVIKYHIWKFHQLTQQKKRWFHDINNHMKVNEKPLFWLIRTKYTSNYVKITCKIATWQLWAKLLVLKLHIAFFLCTKPSDIQIIWEKNVMSCCPNMQRNDWMIEIILFCNFGVPTSTKAIHEFFWEFSS